MFWQIVQHFGCSLFRPVHVTLRLVQYGSTNLSLSLSIQQLARIQTQTTLERKNVT